MELKGIRRILDIYETKTMEVKKLINLLDQVYEALANKITDRDYKLTHEIQGVLDKIDEIQNDIENLNN